MVHHFLNDEDLEQLKKYKYQGSAYTPLDKILNHFWEWSTQFVPMTVAPNMLTFIALLFSLLSCFVICYTSPDFVSECPPWALLVSVFASFMYQTLDAIDGKQARRTKQSSPLGQLFDHGCDSLSASLVALTVCIYVGMGHTIWTFIALLGVQIPVMILNWNEIQTGVFMTAAGDFGVTEGQFFAMAIGLICAVCGHSVFQYQLFAYPTEIANLLDEEYFIVRHLLALIFLVSSATMICKVVPMGLEKAKNKPLAKRQLLGFVFWCVASTAYYVSGAFIEFGVLAWILFAVTFSCMATRLIVCATIHKKFRSFQWPLIPFYTAAFAMLYIRKIEPTYDIVLTNNQTVCNFLFPTVEGDAKGLHLSHAIFITYAVLTLTYFAIWVKTTINDICRGLNIKAFTITPKKDL